MKSSGDVVDDASLQMRLTSLPYAALLLDAAGRILSSNAAARRIFGYRGDSIDGLPIANLMPDLVAAELLTAARRRGSRRREFLGVRRDTTRFPASVRFSRARFRRVPALLLALTDLTRRIEANVRQGRYHFRQLANALPLILFACRRDGSAEYFAPQWIAFTGVALESQQENGWLQQIHEEDRAAIERSWRAALAAERTFKSDFRVRRYDGVYHWFEMTAVPLRERDGVLIRWIGIINDIHEARLNQMALVEERDRFAKLVASAPGAVYAFRLAVDGTASFPFVSAGIKDLVGVSAEEIRSNASRAWKLAHPDDRARLEQSITASAMTLEPWHEEWRVPHPQRGEVWLEAQAVPTREADGTTLWYGIMIDVTQRKHDEEELLRSQARLQAAVLASGIGTYIWDATTGRLWWDDVLLRLFDRTRDEIESGGIEGAALFVQPEDRGLVAQAMIPLRQGKTDTLSVEYRSLRRDGKLQWIAVSGRADRDASGQITRVTGACMDITERKRAEEAQRHSQKIEALGTLAGGIAHDFNNLLLAIAGNTRLAMAELRTGHPARRSLEEIERAGARACDLVHRILAFSHQSESKRATIELQPVIEEALQLLRATLPAMIEIKSRFAADTPAVDADSTQIHQIIMNLVTNSAHAIGDDGGRITIALDHARVEAGDTELAGELAPGLYARICVYDTGCGMDKDTLERVFDPFFTTKPVGQGTGLGLSVVHGIVRSHEGAIAVTSEPRQGTKVSVYLPAASRPGASASEPVPVPTEGSGQRVMYVDDEDALVYLITQVLERLGYAVGGFTDPGRALQAFQEDPHAYDVIVTDVSMPGMSGFNLARALLAIRADIPVVMTSGYIRPQDRESAHKLGIRDLILKPDTIEELGRTLERLFKQHNLPN